jgi:hypothetical protein
MWVAPPVIVHLNWAEMATEVVGAVATTDPPVTVGRHERGEYSHHW